MIDSSAHPQAQPGSHDPTAHQGPGPLAGLRILELGTLLAGPFAARVLGDMGAEVIKIEDPQAPDPLREWGHARYRGRSLWWPVQSRNKKCITLNLRDEAGQDVLLELVKHADVLVENFRPGTLERWNLGFERLSTANPLLILARVSGYGQTGPYAQRAGFASAAEAMGGLRYINGYAGEPPPRFGVSLGDSLAGLWAAQGILAALYRRDGLGSGRGQVIDVSILESCFAMLEGAVPEYDRLGIVREPSGTTLKNVAPSNIYESKDGRWIVIAANKDSVFRRLCDAMNMPEMAADPRFRSHGARGQHQEELDQLIATWAAQRNADDLDQLLNAAGVVCAPIYSVAEIVADPHFRARDMLVTHDDPEFGSYLGPGIVPKFSGTPCKVRWSAPWELGSHNAEIYGDLLQFSARRIDELATEGVI